MSGRQIMTAEEIRRATIRISHEIVEKHAGTEGLALVGIQRRGVPLARRLAAERRSLLLVSRSLEKLEPLARELAQPYAVADFAGSQPFEAVLQRANLAPPGKGPGPQNLFLGHVFVPDQGRPGLYHDFPVCRPSSSDTRQNRLWATG